MHIHDFQLLTASITFAYDVVFRPVHWPIQLTCMFSKRLCPWTSRARRCAHTESSATVLFPMFSSESSFHQRCLGASFQHRYLSASLHQRCLSGSFHESCLSRSLHEKCLSGSLHEKCLSGSVHLPNAKYKSKLKSRLSSPSDLFKRRIRKGSLWADVCHCEKVLEHCRKPVFRLATTGSRAANGSSFRTVCCWNKSCRRREVSAIIQNTETLVTGFLLSFCVVLHCLQIVTNCTVPVYS